MKRIVLDVSKGELDYIREAVEQKHKSLMTYFDACEVEANKPIEVQAWKDYFGAKRDDGIALTSISHPVAKKTTRKTISLNALQVEAIKSLGKKPHWTQTAKGKKILAARKKAKK